MTCIYCEGTGLDPIKRLDPCKVCEGTGYVCDTCGQSIDDGEYLCLDCDTHRPPSPIERAYCLGCQTELPTESGQLCTTCQSKGGN